MQEDIPQDSLPPEKPPLKMSLTGYAFALVGAVLLAAVVGLVLRWWG